MPDYKGALSYGATGAAIGTGILPGIGTAIGGLVGVLGGLFGESEEEQRQKRKNELIQKIRQAYSSAIERTAGATLDTAAFAQQGASRKAASKGEAARSADVAAAVSPVYREGGKAMASITDKMAAEVVGVEGDFAQRPIEPSWGDVLMNAGQQAVKAYTAIQKMDELRKPPDQQYASGAEINLAPGQAAPSAAQLGSPTPSEFTPGSVPVTQQINVLGPTTAYGSRPEDQGAKGVAQGTFGTVEATNPLKDDAYFQALRFIQGRG